MLRGCIGTILLNFLPHPLAASGERRENAEGSEGGTDEQGGMEASDKGILQTNETRRGKALCLRRGEECPRRSAS